MDSTSDEALREHGGSRVKQGMRGQSVREDERGRNEFDGRGDANRWARNGRNARGGTTVGAVPNRPVRVVESGLYKPRRSSRSAPGGPPTKVRARASRHPVAKREPHDATISAIPRAAARRAV